MRTLRPDSEEAIHIPPEHELVSVDPVFDGSALALWKRRSRSSSEGEYAIASVLGESGNYVRISRPNMFVFGSQSDGKGRHALLGHPRLAQTRLFLFDSEGSFLYEIETGDSANRFQMTKSGRHWIGYSDEAATSSNALAREGLVRLGSGGQPEFRYSREVSRSPLNPIFDCYAINATFESEVWAFYYVDFPLVKIVDDRIADFWRPTEWESRVRYASTFSISKNFALFGGRKQETSTWFLLNLDERTSEEVRLKIPEDLSNQTIISVARGPYAYLWTNTWIGRYDMRDLL